MKRILSLALAAAMVLSFTACSGSTSSSSAAANSSAKSEGTQQAADWKPAHDITIRVPKAAGDAMDNITRLVTAGFNKQYGTTIMVNNITGANGAIAAADLMSKKPDVCELMSGGIVLFTLAPLFNPDIKVNPDDYKFVSGLTSENFIMCVNASSGLKSWDDVKKYAKTNRILVGTQPAGGAIHMLATAVFGEAGIKWEAVSSDSSGKDVLALASNEVNIAIATESAFAQYIESGKLVPIMCFGKNSYTGYKGVTVPTAESLGFNGIQFNSLNYLCTRSDVPDSDVKAMYDSIKTYSNTDEFKASCTKSKITPYVCSGDECKQTVASAETFCKNMYEKYYANSSSKK